MIQASADGTEPRFLVRDRDRIYGEEFRARVKAIDIEEILTAPKSPWQNPFAERMIGTLRRDCLAHVVVLGEFNHRIILRRYLSDYHRARTHLALEKDAPEPRPVQTPEHGHMIPEVGGLHHRYERHAA
jgi:transposase InsO family protein